MKNAANPNGSCESKNSILKKLIAGKSVTFKVGTGAFRNAKKLVKDGLALAGKKEFDKDRACYMATFHPNKSAATA